ncbi:MAG: proline dehydrogenase family protein [Chloroflexota bacterium]
MATTAPAGESAQRPGFDFNPVFRKGILAATQNPLVAKNVRAHGMRLGAARFVAGETFDEAAPVLRGLNARGVRTNTTLLGEGVRDVATARAVTDTYKGVLDRIAEERLITNIALKPTHLGLDLGEDLAFAHLSEIVGHAASHGNFIRIDMEESARVDATLRLYRRLRAEGHDNVGTVLQSYLYRTDDDLSALIALRPNLRLVKGAYLEPPDLAYPEKRDVDAAYVRQAERMLTECGFAAIATHDDRIIDHVIGYAARHGFGHDRYEFQMLYGIRSQYQTDLVQAGHRVLIATPYGPEWYFYLMRRLAERPANVGWFASNLFRR